MHQKTFPKVARSSASVVLSAASMAVQHCRARSGAAAIVERNLAVPVDARDRCAREAHSFHNYPAEFRLQNRPSADWLLLTCPLQENILYFSWTGTPSALVPFFFFFPLLIPKYVSLNIGIDPQSES